LSETNSDGEIIRPEVRFQLNKYDQSYRENILVYHLVFLLEGRTESNQTRYFNLCFTTNDSAYKQPEFTFSIYVEHFENYENFPAFKISTPSASYYYHKKSSGFASLIDIEGNDWISYHPEGGFKGNYRGIPNIAPPQFHPGRPEGKKTSKILDHGPLKLRIFSQTEDENWSATWDFYPSYATMTLSKTCVDSFWILYEGTPGGKLEPESDFWVNSAGKKFDMKPYIGEKRWNGVLPNPQWVYFADPKLNRSMFYILHEDDEVIDEFWWGKEGHDMTVFGFGRGPRPQWQYLHASPVHLTVGFAESTEFNEVEEIINGAYRNLKISVGEIQRI
jgi:hypothetical protein